MYEQASFKITKTSSANCRFLPKAQQDDKNRKAAHSSKSHTILDTNKQYTSVMLPVYVTSDAYVQVN